MRIEKRENWKPETNCFLNDAFLMGQQIGQAPGAVNNDSGQRIMIMMENFEHDICLFIIVINERTGEQIKISFVED